MTPTEILQHLDQATLWPADTDTDARPGTATHTQAPAALADDVAGAYQSALQVRQLRMDRGEVPRGYKIGFTNRSIWPRYNVLAPIWGTVWNTTLEFCEGDAAIALSGRCQPRIEPEAVFGMRATPPANATLEALYDCIEWVAPGFEIVQSHAANWKFNAAMAVRDGGLHSHLLVGRRVAVNTIAPSAQALNLTLAGCQVALHKDGALAERGQGLNVLDGPVLALSYFLGELRQCKAAPDLKPGDVITTGTWTDAWPVQAGETWRADFQAPLSPLSVKFT